MNAQLNREMISEAFGLIKKAKVLHPNLHFYVIRMGFIPYLDSLIHNFTRNLDAQDFLATFLLEPESISQYENYWSMTEALPEVELEFILIHADEFNQLIDTCEHYFYEAISAANLSISNIDLLTETSFLCLFDQSSVVLYRDFKYEFNYVDFRQDKDTQVQANLLEQNNTNTNRGIIN